MKKNFILIVLAIIFCTIISWCSPKSNLETETPQIVSEITWDNIVTWLEIEAEESQETDTDTELILNHEKAIEMPICTADVKQCNDGSYVSRWWPNCEFSPCPWDNLDKDTATITKDTSWNEKLNTDEIIDKLTEYWKSWDFDEEWVDILYEIIDSLSE